VIKTHEFEGIRMSVEQFPKRFEYYWLDENKRAIPCSRDTWSELFDRENRSLADEDIEGKRVSTVFLGLNHNHDIKSTIPLIFETMVFNENHSDIYMDRYSTWEEAEEGHKKAVEWVKAGCIEDDLD
jgi:hypothetical protein